MKRERISQVLVDLLKAKGIKVIDKDVLVNSLKLFSEKNMDFVDCLLCAYGIRYKVASFDKKVVKCLQERARFFECDFY